VFAVRIFSWFGVFLDGAAVGLVGVFVQFGFNGLEILVVSQQHRDLLMPILLISLGIELVEVGKYVCICAPFCCGGDGFFGCLVWQQRICARQSFSDCLPFAVWTPPTWANFATMTSDYIGGIETLSVLWFVDFIMDLLLYFGALVMGIGKYGIDIFLQYQTCPATLVGGSCFSFCVVFVGCFVFGVSMRKYSPV